MRRGDVRLRDEFERGLLCSRLKGGMMVVGVRDGCPLPYP